MSAKVEGIELSKSLRSKIAADYSKGRRALMSSGAFLIATCKSVASEAKGKPILKDCIDNMVANMEPNDEPSASRLRNVLRTYSVLPEALMTWERDFGIVQYQAVCNVASALLKSRDNETGAFNVKAACERAASKVSSRAKGGKSNKPSRAGSMASAAIHLKCLRSMKRMPAGFAADVEKLAKKYKIELGASK